MYEHLLAYTMCLEEWPSVRIRTIYAITVLALQFAAPVFVLSAIHLRICCFLRRQVSGSALISRDSRRAANIARRYRKNLALLVTISAMFAVCWLPLVLLILLADLASEVFAATDFTLAFATAHVIAMSSACINPVLYGWFNPSFKHELKRLLLFWLRDTTNQSSESQSEAPPLSRPHSQSPPHSPPHSPLQSPPQLAPSCPEASVPTFNRRTRYSTFSIRNNIVKSGVSQWTKSGDSYYTSLHIICVKMWFVQSECRKGERSGCFRFEITICDNDLCRGMNVVDSIYYAIRELLLIIITTPFIRTFE